MGGIFLARLKPCPSRHGYYPPFEKREGGSTESSYPPFENHQGGQPALNGGQEYLHHFAGQGRLGEKSHKPGEADDERAAALMKINSELRDEVVGEGELGDGGAGDGDLAEAEQAHAELRNCDQAEGELSDGDDADGRNRLAV